MSVVIDPYRVSLLERRIRDEIDLQTRYNNTVKGGGTLDEYTKNKLASLSAREKIDEFEDRILRELLTGTDDGKLPSEELEQYILESTTITQDTIDVNKLKSSEMERSPSGMIISNEVIDSNESRWIEVPLTGIRFASSRFEYILDTKFKEFVPEKETLDRQRMNELEAEIEKYRALANSLQSTIDGYAESNELLKGEKDRLALALERANKAIDELGAQFEEANKALQEQLAKSAQDSKQDDGLDDILNELLDRLGSKDDVKPPVIDSIQPVKFKAATAFTLTVKGKNFNRNSLIIVDPHGKLTTEYIDSNTLSAKISATSQVATVIKPKQVSVMNTKEDGTKLVSKSVPIAIDFTSNDTKAPDTDLKNKPAV